MGRTTQAGWSAPQTDVLKKSYEDGISAAEIATKINAEFGTAYSRNAVIGRATRIGLVSKNRPGQSTINQPRPPRERKPRVRIIRSNGNSTRQRVIESVESEPFALRCVEITPRAISILELETDDCRYPYGTGAEITFCGHGPLHRQITFDRLTGESTKKTSSYCKAHHFLCVGPGTYSEQRANVVAKELVA